MNSTSTPLPAFILLRSSAKPILFWKEDAYSANDILAHSATLATLYSPAPAARVMIFSENRPAWISALYAIWRNAGIAVPVDFLCPAGELAGLLRQTEPAAVFCSATTEPVLREALATFPGPAPLVLSFDAPRFPAFPRNSAAQPELPSGPADAPAAILFTSGTTGNPKGVLLSFGNLLVNLDSVCRRVPIFTPATRTFALLPLHHILPLMGCVVAPLHSGGIILLSHTLDPAAMVAAMKHHRATLIIGVPRLYSLLCKAIMETLNRSLIGRLLFRLSARINRLAVSRVLLFPVQRKFGGHLRQMVCGGAPLESGVGRDLTHCGFQILEGYGMTECAPMIAFPRPGAVRLGSCGNPCIPDSIKIEDGEILARGPHVFSGYWRNPDATAEALRDGWLHTGDLGYLDTDHYLFITGRKKELLVLPNGKKVNPVELEDALTARADGLQEIAVTLRDNLLHVLLLPLPGLCDGIPAQQAAHFRSALLEPYNRLVPPAKKITRLTIVTAPLPKTRIGKLKRHELPALAVGTFAAVPLSPPPEELGPAWNAFESFLKTDLDCPEVAPSSQWEMDLALDSLARLSVLVFIEKTFGVKFPESIFAECPTVLDLARRADAARTHFRTPAPGFASLLSSAKPNTADSDAADAPSQDLPRSSWIHTFLKNASGLLLRLLFRVSAEGLENRPAQGPALLVPNHQSYIDGLFISMFLTNRDLHRTFYYAKSKHVKPGFLTWLARRCNVIVVDVDRDIRGSLQNVAQALRNGGRVILFPEGTRCEDGKLGDFRSTFAVLALELGVPVHPIAIRDAWRALPRGRWRPRLWTSVRIRFLPPMPDAARTDETHLTDATRDAIARNL